MNRRFGKKMSFALWARGLVLALFCALLVLSPTHPMAPNAAWAEWDWAQAECSPGDRGEIVEILQWRLIDLNYMSGEADGVYGSQTERAVLAFQRAVDLPQTGIADSETYLLLLSDEAPVYEDSIEQIVYVAPYSGKKYHIDEHCRTLKKARSVESREVEDAIAEGFESACKVCSGG